MTTPAHNRYDYLVRHRRHWAYAALLVALSALVQLTGPRGWLLFVQMLLLAAAAAQVAFGRQVLQRGRDEPVFEVLLQAEERRLNKELERRHDW